jgi:hypothetical protein
MLERVGDHQGYLGLRTVRRPVVSHDSDQTVTDLGHEGQPIDVVHAGESVYLGGGELRMDTEEAPVHRTWSELLVKRNESCSIIGTDRSNMHRNSGRGHHIAFQI